MSPLALQPAQAGPAHRGPLAWTALRDAIPLRMQLASAVNATLKLRLFQTGAPEKNGRIRVLFAPACPGTPRCSASWAGRRAAAGPRSPGRRAPGNPGPSNTDQATTNPNSKPTRGYDEKARPTEINP